MIVPGLVLWASIFCFGFNFASDTSEVILVVVCYVKQA